MSAKLCGVQCTTLPEEHPVKAFGWAARDQSGHLYPFKFSRSYMFLRH